jgi:hypothetical protein
VSPLPGNGRGDVLIKIRLVPTLIPSVSLTSLWSAEAELMAPTVRGKERTQPSEVHIMWTDQ